MATTTFNDLITFSRGSNATVTGPNGLIQWAPSNLLTNSESFEASVWLNTTGGTGVASTVTANAGAAPDGTLTADRLQFSLGGGTAFADITRRRQDFTTSATTHTFSVYLRSTDGISTYDMHIVGPTGSTTNIVVTGSWQRFSVSGVGAGATVQYAVGLRGGQTPANSNTADVLIWGAQLELGSTATTYNNTSVRNLLGFSEAFDNAAWSKTGASIVTGAQANPINSLFNAQKLMEDTSSGLHSVTSTAVSLAAGLPCVGSVYAKAAGRNLAYLQFSTTPFGTVTRAWFDLSTGTAGPTSNCTAVMTPVGNGWYRCAIYATTTVGGSTSLLVAATATTILNTYTGDGNSGVYIYGAMLSNSASLDPYVPTPGAAPSSTAYYGPRFDYDPVTLLPRGLLVEEARTNLHVQSEAFSSPWITTRASVVSAAVQAPSGANNVIAFTEDATNGSSHELYQNTIKAASAITYTYSLYVKKAGRNWIGVTIWDNSANGNRFWFNVNTGAKGSTTTFGTPFTSATYDIVAAPAGFYRIFVTLTSNTATNLAVTLYSTDADGSNTPAVALNAAGLYVYGSQLEAGAFATSYIPTIASTVTRSADVATITGSLFSQWYNQSAGSFIVVADSPGVSGAANITTVDDGTLNERIRILTDVLDPKVIVTDGGVTQANIDAGAITALQPFNMSAAYALNDIAACLNGGTVGTDTSATLPTVTILRAGADSAGNYLNGHIRSIRYVPVRAADFQLQALTAPPELLSSNIYDRFNDLVLDRAGQTIEVR